MIFFSFPKPLAICSIILLNEKKQKYFQNKIEAELETEI